MGRATLLFAALMHPVFLLLATLGNQAQEQENLSHFQIAVALGFITLLVLHRLTRRGTRAAWSVSAAVLVLGVAVYFKLATEIRAFGMEGLIVATTTVPLVASLVTGIRTPRQSLFLQDSVTRPPATLRERVTRTASNMRRS